MSEGSLRDYQLEDAKFLAQRSRAACFNEQRTGKTPTICKVLQLRGLAGRRVLIVAPKSALLPWADEYTRWTGERSTVCTGTPAQRKNVVSEWTEGALLISYDTLKRTTRLDKKTGLPRCYGELDTVLGRSPDCVILDEAHRIKDRETANAGAAFKLAERVPNRYALTGTPAPGRPYDVWSILNFLFPEKFASYWKFIEAFFTPERKTNHATGKTYIDEGALNSTGRKFMLNVLPLFSTQRKRKDVMPWLTDDPPITVRLPLVSAQKKALDELAETWETGDIVTKGVLDRLIRYRQICLDPNILGIRSVCPKTAWILDYIDDYPDRSIIIFSKFTTYLHRLSDAIEQEHGLIVGATSAKDRAEYVKRFQDKSIKILLLQIDTSKEALTLDTAEATIFTDRYPPYGDLMQAEARFVASTESRADKLNLIYYLVMRGSYDEELQQVIASRGSEIDVINNFNKYLTERRMNHGNHT